MKCVKPALIACIFVIFFVLASPWTLPLFNRVEPWIGPLPFGAGFIIIMLFVAGFLLALLENYETRRGM
ncbi:MAG TPA: hypothetical protein GX507_03570 [Clostridia bacterium]|nr:hypothetical protein [Clostridia bacterium]